MKDADHPHKPTQPASKPGVLNGFMNRLEGWLSRTSPEDEIIEQVVTTIEPRLKQVRRYRRDLKEPVQICQEHCRTLVAAIPGPVMLKRNGYGSDPLLRALFLKTEQFEQLLNQADLQRTENHLSGSRRVALLSMASKEKTIFGRKQHGEMMVADAAMRAITFTDHILVGLATNLSESKHALEKHALDIIAEAAARHLSEARTRLVDLRERQERLRAMEKMFGSRSGRSMGSAIAQYDPEQSEKQQEIEHLLAETEDKLAVARSRSETPEDWLKIVAAFLSRPSDILSMKRISLRLNWKNVITDDPSEKADIITLGTFNIGDELQREGVLVEYELR